MQDVVGKTSRELMPGQDDDWYRIYGEAARSKLELRKQTVLLESVLASAASLVRTACASKGQELTISLPPQPVYLHADPTRLEQVFGNLLGNAAKYAGAGCHISLSAELAPGGGEVLVRVADDGAGIDPELLPRIFDLFVQSIRPPVRIVKGPWIARGRPRRPTLPVSSYQATMPGAFSKGRTAISRLVDKPAPGLDSPPHPSRIRLFRHPRFEVHLPDTAVLSRSGAPTIMGRVERLPCNRDPQWGLRKRPTC